jgi:molybdenum cofactor cytidylyltransferase
MNLLDDLVSSFRLFGSRAISFRLGCMTMPAIILAAGGSNRLGRPKQLVRVAGETLLDRTVRLAQEAGAEPVIVVLGGNRESIVADADLQAVVAVENEDWRQGIASSIRTGVLAAQVHNPDGVLLLVCDQPGLSSAFLGALIQAFNNEMQPVIVASSYANVAGIPVIFPASLFAELLRLQGDTGARSILRDPRCRLITLPFAEGAVDIDTPQDLQTLLRVEGVE